MSILIEGIEIPKSPVLFCIHPDGKVFADLEGGWREYKAVPVPAHGRLIYASAIWNLLYDYADSIGVPDMMRFDKIMEAAFSNAPTIIPAESDEERREYEAQVESAQYCEMYEPTYDPETGSM